MKVRQRGFTLLELMIVVAVIAILASIALPFYGDQVEKGRRAEGKAALLRTALAQERHYTNSGSYATSVSTLVTQDGLSGVDTSGNTETGYYVVSILAGAGTTFTAQAQTQGSQTGDNDFCAVFSIDNLGVKSAVDGASNDTTGVCWTR